MNEEVSSEEEGEGEEEEVERGRSGQSVPISPAGAEPQTWNQELLWSLEPGSSRMELF